MVRNHLDEVREFPFSFCGIGLWSHINLNILLTKFNNCKLLSVTLKTGNASVSRISTCHCNRTSWHSMAIKIHTQRHLWFDIQQKAKIFGSTIQLKQTWKGLLSDCLWGSTVNKRKLLTKEVSNRLVSDLNVPLVSAATVQKCVTFLLDFNLRLNQVLLYYSKPIKRARRAIRGLKALMNP